MRVVRASDRETRRGADHHGRSHDPLGARRPPPCDHLRRAETCGPVLRAARPGVQPVNRLAADYRLERHAQDQRFNNRPGAGGVDATQTGSEEYRAYFGLGDFAGSGVEDRVTYRTYLSARGAERRAAEASRPVEEGVPAGELVRWPGDALAYLAGAGDLLAVAEVERRRLRREEKRLIRLAVTA